MRMKQCEIWRKPGNRMHLYWYKQKMRQCEILLAHTGSIQTLKTVPPSLASYVGSTVDPTPYSSQVPSQGPGQMGWPSTAEYNAACADALEAVKQITQPLPTSCTTSESISLMDSDEPSVAGTQGGSSSTTTNKKQVGNVEPVARSVSNNTQELRMTLPKQVHSPSLAWSYLSNWSDDLPPLHIIPPSPLNSHQSQLG